MKQEVASSPIIQLKEEVKVRFLDQYGAKMKEAWEKNGGANFTFTETELKKLLGNDRFEKWGWQIVKKFSKQELAAQKQAETPAPATSAWSATPAPVQARNSQAEGAGESTTLAVRPGPTLQPLSWFCESDDSNHYFRCDQEFSEKMHQFAQRGIPMVTIKRAGGQMYDIRFFFPKNQPYYAQQFRRGAYGTSRIVTSQQPDDEGKIDWLPAMEADGKTPVQVGTFGLV